MSSNSTRRRFLKASGGAVLGAVAASNILPGALPYVARAASPSVSIVNPATEYDLIGLAGSGYRTWLDGSNGRYSYGAWVDGPFNPFRATRDGAQHIGALVPHSQNYLLNIPDNWVNTGMSLQPQIALDSPNNPEVAQYNNRHWLIGTFSVGSTVYSLAHCENYYACLYDAGKWWPWISTGHPTSTHPNYKWTPSICLWKSTDGGKSFRLAHSPSDGSDKNILTPRPADGTSATGGWDAYQDFGFYHPTNVVQEGNYIYCFIEHRPASNPGWFNVSTFNSSQISGSTLIRVPINRIGQMGNPANDGGHYWELFAADHRWHPIARYNWQGNTHPDPTQRPHIFLKQLAYDYNNWSAGGDAVQNVRRVGSHWVTLGNVGGYGLFYSYTPTLESPLPLDTNLGTVVLNGLSPVNVQRTGWYRYLSFFDVGTSPSDLNFEQVRQDTTSDVRLVISNGVNCSEHPGNEHCQDPANQVTNQPTQSQYRFWNLQFSGF